MDQGAAQACVPRAEEVSWWAVPACVACARRRGSEEVDHASMCVCVMGEGGEMDSARAWVSTEEPRHAIIEKNYHRENMGAEGRVPAPGALAAPGLCAALLKARRTCGSRSVLAVVKMQPAEVC